ncbi:YchJ family protein [Vibrio sp.]|uniref:YchJ family protein n=1 Tax=Vibrio sp. TaxID=678 RepID=UPI003D141502
MSTVCYCGSKQPFTQCCQPYLSGNSLAPTPEALMRSRYSAYYLANYNYVLATYAQAQRQPLNVAELERSASGTNWLALRVHTHKDIHPNQVEFSAFYVADRQLGVLHETSNFVQEDGQWRYVDGTLHSDCGIFQPGRNDECFCGSGKKFKKCCMAYIQSL